MQKDELTELALSTGFPRISIYIPTHRTYPETEQDPIRLSNALKEAERQLLAAGLTKGRVDELLSAARQRTTDSIFWRYQDEGLAVFIEKDRTRWMTLPAAVPELTVVAERYHVLPLIGIFADRGRFHLLAATRDSVRFFDGSERDLQSAPVEGLPASLAEVKARTDFDDHLGYHSRGRGSAGAAAPKYHALGESPEDYEEIELEQYARAIAKAVDGHLAGRGSPLILAARPRLLGRLRQELRYRHLADTDIKQDPAAMSEEELHTRAWAIASPILRRSRDAARERFAARLDGADIPGSSDVQELMAAAEEGRLATLLIAPGAVLWGSYDAEGRKVSIAAEPGPDNEDILNLLALKALAQGGEVISLPDTLSRRTGPAAGLFRY